jgi:secreted trypsin-like serine protease
VRLGEWDTSKTVDCDFDGDCVEEPVQDIQIERYIVHDDYNFHLKDSPNDIALIKLSRPAIFNFYVAPICLPHTDRLKKFDLEGQSLVVAGWGRTESGSQSNIKQKVDVPVVSARQCQEVLETKVTDSLQICAGGVKGKDSCNGDSGGPLMKHHWDDKKQFVFLAGIVSYGKDCGREGYPAVYTRVSSYIDWIIGNLQ